MPKLFVHSAQGVFTAATRAKVAAELTDLGMACERLSSRASVRAGVWVFFEEYASDAAFSGGEIMRQTAVVLNVFTLEGGLDETSKARLIAEATAIIAKYAKLLEKPEPVFVLVHQVPEANWGMAGKQVSLAALRADD